MSIEEIRRMDDPLLTPEQAAQVLGCNPQSIRVAAREKPELLGFPVIRVGTRTKIPREPFLQFITGRACE